MPITQVSRLSWVIVDILFMTPTVELYGILNLRMEDLKLLMVNNHFLVRQIKMLDETIICCLDG